jgi:hypothetical protein
MTLLIATHPARQSADGNQPTHAIQPATNPLVSPPPSLAKPSLAKPSLAKPGQASPGQARPGQAKLSQAKPGQAKLSPWREYHRVPHRREYHRVPHHRRVRIHTSDGLWSACSRALM